MVTKKKDTFGNLIVTIEVKNKKGLITKLKKKICLKKPIK